MKSGRRRIKIKASREDYENRINKREIADRKRLEEKAREVEKRKRKSRGTIFVEPVHIETHA